MATRSIVTSHPEVACDVCGRRLLRGEQPDVFLSAGQRRTVCELCVPRAAHEGWLREADDRSLLGRLRQTRWPSSDRSTEEPASVSEAVSPLDLGDREEDLYDFLDSPLTQATPVGARSRSSSSEPVPSRPVSASGEVAPTSGDRSKIGRQMERALEVFNGGDQPRRLAGVARSLGAPTVRVAPTADSSSVVTLVVAWELCWYRYEVDLGEESAGAQLTAQGMELQELPGEDRVGNAELDERGALSLLA